MKFIKTLSALALLLSLSAQAQTAGPAVRYVGSDGNWFNPANWSGGRVPGAADDVVIDGRAEVVIDGALGPAEVQVRDLVVSGAARLVGLRRITLETRSTTLQERGATQFSESAEIGGSLVVAPYVDPQGCTDCVISQNPNPKTKRVVVLQSSVTLAIGLGGTEPATITKTGAGRLILASGQGYYSTMTGQTTVLDGTLRLTLHYGFLPRPGDRFQIVTATETRRGQFLGLPEGGLVGCSDGNVGLFISYVGGDGNDVVLSAAETSPQSCLLLPAVQKVREAAARSAAQSIGDLTNTTGGLLLPAVQKVREAAR